jgi:hypothetical protein
MSNLTKEEELAEREYTELGLNMRHYGNMHLVQLTIFFAVSGVMFWNVVEKEASMPKVALCSANVAGFVLCILFILMARRVCDNWDKLLARAKVLETTLGFQQYTVPPTPRFFTNRTAIYCIYGVVGLLWLVNIFVPAVTAAPREHCHERCTEMHKIVCPKTCPN